MVSGLLCTIVILQFVEVLPWVGDPATHIGGPLTGAVTYGLAAGVAFGAGYGWLTIKPWSSMATIFAAALGIFAPFISYMDGTDPRSSAIAPVATSVLMLVLVFRPSTNRAMKAALSGEGSTGVAKEPPPAKPMSAARKRELAAERAIINRELATAPPPKPVIATATSAAAATLTQAAAALPKPAAAAPVRPAFAGLAKNAAAALGMQSRSPARPSAAPSPVAAPRPPAPAAPAGAPNGQRPRGFRADEV